MLEIVKVCTPANEVFPELSKVIPPPLAGACHSSPVAVALFATILQEQSQRIVLSTQLRLNSSQFQKPSVGIGVGAFQNDPSLIQDG
jgi:hypothetical protein